MLPAQPHCIETQHATDLDSHTWTRGEGSELFAKEVELAMKAGMHLLLVHEMPGIGQETRWPCDFGKFFQCDEGSTPPSLLKQGIYDESASSEMST